VQETLLDTGAGGSPLCSMWNGHHVPNWHVHLRLVGCPTDTMDCLDNWHDCISVHFLFTEVRIHAQGSDFYVGDVHAIPCCIHIPFGLVRGTNIYCVSVLTAFQPATGLLHHLLQLGKVSHVSQTPKLLIIDPLNVRRNQDIFLPQLSLYSPNKCSPLLLISGETSFSHWLRLL